MKNKQAISQWLDLLKKKSDFSIKYILFKESTAWIFNKGHLIHKSKHFFRIIGVEANLSDGSCSNQPLIDQREIGILGFLIYRKKTGNEILMQAKLEPGNVGLIQLAPTCQATKSNSECFHGGKKPPFIEYFKKDQKSVYDVLQSEQGTRFFKKRNRNVLSLISKKILPGKFHKWVNVSDMLNLLKVDYLINTDARSVLVCSPWEKLLGREPFTRYKKGFGAELLHSFQSKEEIIKLKDVKFSIRKKRKRIEKQKIICLKKIINWTVKENGIFSNDEKKFNIRQVKVHARGREVSDWDQPIAESLGEGRICLICARKNGIMYFLFVASEEIGLYNKVELNPSITIIPGDDKEKWKIPSGISRLKCRQSEEGGRFLLDINIFEIIDVGDAYNVSEGYYWLNLYQIKKLLNEPGWFTNEARSAISLLLNWL